MGYINPGINQVGGKYRLRKELVNHTPFHDYFISLFCGSCVYELNKKKAYKYECFNDLDSNYINYFEVIRDFPQEFDSLKEGVLGLISQKIFNDMKKGKIIPHNKIEQAFFFFYSNRIGFGGSGSYDYDLIKQIALGYFNLDLVNLYKWNIRQLRELFKFNIDLQPEIKKTIKMIKNLNKQLRNQALEYCIKPAIEVNMNYRGATLPTVMKEYQTKESIEYYKNISRIFPSFRGTNPKTTRPISNADGGLYTMIDPQAIERLRYVNLTSYDFRKVYKSLLTALNQKKGLTKQVFVYADPPYPDTEEYYTLYRFTLDDHYDLINIMKESPFHFNTSIGGECKFYLEEFKDLKNWHIIPQEVKYCTSANNQEDKQEYFICNYDISKVPKMIHDSNQNTLERFF